MSPRLVAMAGWTLSRYSRPGETGLSITLVSALASWASKQRAVGCSPAARSGAISALGLRSPETYREANGARALSRRAESPHSRPGRR